MYPLLLEIGPIAIYSLWIFVAAGFLFGLLIMQRLSQKSRLKTKFLADHSLLIFFGGLVLSRIFYVVRNLDTYFPDISLQSALQVLSIWDKGLSPWGAIVGVLLSTAFFAWKNDRENLLRWIDATTVSILGAMTCIHVGAFLDGRNFGRETALPWGVTIESSLYAVPIHPVQMYAALYTGALTCILYALSQKKTGKEAGNVSIVALGAYSALRLLEDFLRGDESHYFLGLREAKWYALIGIAVAGVLWYRRKKRTVKEIMHHTSLNS